MLTILSKNDLRQLLKRSLIAVALLTVLVGIGLIIDALSAGRAVEGLDLAQQFPRGALVYAQFKDLPDLLKSWDESELKERYLQSTSFQQLQSRHLALKLVERWEEFSDATGFPIDTAALSGMAEQRAAIAVYDIKRLDLVLIAPLGAERYAASMFYLGKDRFQAMESPDGTAYYLRDLDEDRGGEKQAIGFALANGHFVAATSEKLLLRAIANLNGQAKKDRLTDEPMFEALSKAVTPHLLTVWVDQAKLNEDWYFKKYWVMQNVQELKNIRSGIFDLDLRDDKWVEQREFLLDEKNAGPRAALSLQTLQRIEQIIPADAPFVKLRVIGNNSSLAADLVIDTLFERRNAGARQGSPVGLPLYSKSDSGAAPESGSGAEGETMEGDTEGQSEEGAEEGAEMSDEDREESTVPTTPSVYMSQAYNLTIDDPDDAQEEDGTGGMQPGKGQPGKGQSGTRLVGERGAAARLRRTLQKARPSSIAVIGRPRILEGLFFAEFGRAAILTLQSPGAFDSRMLERAIGELAASKLMIAGAPARFEWKGQNRDDARWREMQLPMLGRGLGYGIRGQELILSNDSALLAELMSNKPEPGRAAIQMSSPVYEMAVIRLDRREEAFDPIFARLDQPRIKEYWRLRRGESKTDSKEDQSTDIPAGPSMEFFSGEIASLLDVASPVREIRIQRGFAAGRLREEVTINLK